MAYAKARLGFSHPLRRLALWAVVAVGLHAIYNVTAEKTMNEQWSRLMILALGLILLVVVILSWMKIRRGRELSRRFHP